MSEIKENKKVNFVKTYCTKKRIKKCKLNNDTYIVNNTGANNSFVYSRWWMYALVCFLHVRHAQFSINGVKSSKYLNKNFQLYVSPFPFYWYE